MATGPAGWHLRVWAFLVWMSSRAHANICTSFGQSHCMLSATMYRSGTAIGFSIFLHHGDAEDEGTEQSLRASVVVPPHAESMFGLSARCLFSTSRAQHFHF